MPAATEEKNMRKNMRLWIAASIILFLIVATLIIFLWNVPSHGDAPTPEDSQQPQAVETPMPTAPGSVVTFGKYYQDKSSNSMVDIEWYVLAELDGDLLLMSKYCLDVCKWGKTDAKWKDSYLRSWLNDETVEGSKNKGFLYTAFDDTQRNCICSAHDKGETGVAESDKVFALAIEDIKGDNKLQLFKSHPEFLSAEPTDYTAVQRPGTYESCCWWWTRSIGQKYPIFIGGNGGDQEDQFVVSESVNDCKVAVRPAIWIKAEAFSSSPSPQLPPSPQSTFQSPERERSWLKQKWNEIWNNTGYLLAFFAFLVAILGVFITEINHHKDTKSSGTRTEDIKSEMKKQIDRVVKKMDKPKNFLGRLFGWLMRLFRLNKTSRQGSSEKEGESEEEVAHSEKAHDNPGPESHGEAAKDTPSTDQTGGKSSRALRDMVRDIRDILEKLCGVFRRVK